MVTRDSQGAQMKPDEEIVSLKQLLLEARPLLSRQLELETSSFPRNASTVEWLQTFLHLLDKATIGYVDQNTRLH